MSTLLIDTKKLNKCASSLVYNEKFYPNTNTFDHEIYRFFGLCGFKNNIDDLSIEVTKFVTDLAMANNLAYEIRYSETINNASLVKIDRRKTFDNLCSMLKFLKCVRYNCDFDRTCTTSNELSLKLDDLIDIISNNIICQLPEYQKAEWC